jgi:hypothetical protein
MSLGLRLAKAVEDVIATSGFRYVRKQNAFLRTAPHGFDQVLWTSHPTQFAGRSGQRYSLVSGVRHEVVEELVNQLGLVYGAENQRATTTVSCALFCFPINPSRSYSLFLPDKATESELHAGAMEISDTLVTDLFPFFNRYSSLVECAQGLGSDRMARPHHLCNNYEARMYRAIAASCLSGGVSVAEQFELWRASYPEVLPETIHAKVAARLRTLAGLLSGS